VTFSRVSVIWSRVWVRVTVCVKVRVEVAHCMVLSNNNNNNNNPICKAPECQKTSVALTDN